MCVCSIYVLSVRYIISLLLRTDDDDVILIVRIVCSQDPTINTVIASPSNVVDSPISETSTSLAAALLSPYHAITTPRLPTRRTDSQCSSSDISSSIVSGHQSGTGGRLEDGAETASAATAGACGGSRTRRDTYEASSGYESMMRDSEEMTSNQDSAGEDGHSTAASIAARLKGNRTFRKKGKLS